MLSFKVTQKSLIPTAVYRPFALILWDWVCRKTGHTYWQKIIFSKYEKSKNGFLLAVVVAQLAVQLLLTPEVCSSNPVIDKILYKNAFTVLTVEKTKIKKMRQRMANFI